MNNYIDSIKDKIDENTVWCVDPGDLGKKHSKKLEYLDVIKDGSTGAYINGYKMVEIAGLTQNEKLPIPVYSRLFSSAEENFVSENEECMDGLKYIKEKFGSKGIYALDRWFDNSEYFKYFSNQNLNFVIRMKKNRNVTICKSGKTRNIRQVAVGLKCKGEYEYKDKYGIKRKAVTGYVKVRVPELEEKEYYLVVIKSTEFPKAPMMLLTNIKPGNDNFYVRRWKIEEYFKFKKQQFKFEKILVRSIKSLRTVNMLLSIVIGFIGIFSDNQKYGQYLIVFKTAKSLKTNEKIVLVYYAIERGLNKKLSYNNNGIKNIYSRKKEKSEQCILPEFSDFNCFIN